MPIAKTLIRRFSSFLFSFFFFFLLSLDRGCLWKFTNCQLGIIGRFGYVGGGISYGEAQVWEILLLLVVS